MIELETRNTRQSISSEHELNTIIIHAMSSCYAMLCRHAMLCYVVMLCRRRTQSTSYNFGNSLDKLRLLKTLYKLCLPEKNSKTLHKLRLSEKNSKPLDKLYLPEKNSKTLDKLYLPEKNSKTLDKLYLPEKNSKTLDKLYLPEKNSKTLDKQCLQGSNSKQSTSCLPGQKFNTHTQQTITLWQAFKTVDSKPCL